MVTLSYRKRHSRYYRDGNITMDIIIVFAIFSGRRMSEITRINRTDTDYDRWFPFVARSVGDYYRRMRKETGYDQYFDGKEEEPDNLNLRFHDLRHECTSWLFEKNGLGDERWDVPRVALVTGHQNWNSLKRYANLRHIKPIDRWADWEWKEKVLD